MVEGKYSRDETPADPVEHDIALQRRRIISALAKNVERGDGSYAMLSIPRRFAGSLLAQFKRAGFAYRTGWSPSEDLLSLTIWQPAQAPGEDVTEDVTQEEERPVMVVEVVRRWADAAE